MASTAAEQLNRIISLVAEQTRRAETDTPEATLDELARRFDTTPAQIQADIRVLTHFGDHAEADWLLSLRVWQEGDRVAIRSRGPYRRPVRFTPEEVCAIQVALEGEGAAGRALAAKIGEAMRVAGEPDALPAVGMAGVPVADLMQDAVARTTRLQIRYAGERGTDREPRVIQPHQLFEYNGRMYVVAWCEQAEGWRHFRLDRILEATAATPAAFERRADFQPVSDAGQVLAAPDRELDEAFVRFTADVARWIRERYADRTEHEDGSVTVRFKVANTQWLVRRVLQYGDAAEVLEPPAYRDAVAAACDG